MFIIYFYFFMTKSLFISNVAWTATNETLQQHLSSKGANVLQVNIIHDRETGRSRGFAFATVETQDDMDSVTTAFNNTEFLGRPLSVTVARPKQ